MICLNCGLSIEGRKRKYCDRICSKRYSNRKRYGCDLSIFEATKPIVSNKPVILHCLVCCSAFKRTKNGGADGNQYTQCCSSICGIRHRTNVLAEIKAIRRIASRDKNLFNYKVSERTKRLIGIDHQYAKHNHCRTCGDGIKQESSQCCKRYCDSCIRKTKTAYLSLKSTRELVNKNRSRNRKAGLAPLGDDKSRAKYYGVKYEPIKRKVVFDKAEWCCEQCGVSTPIEMKGKNKCNSPELDHIIPISKGGSHTYTNVQLLCRQCNATKFDAMPY